MDENPFAEFKVKRVQGGFSYLTEDELQTFYNAYSEGVFDAKYHKVLEFFLFLCFSSLHISDAMQLRLEQFTDDSFVYFRQKNRNKKNAPVTVPVSEVLKSIIRNIVGPRKKGLIFEKLPEEQTMELCQSESPDAFHCTLYPAKNRVR